MKKGITIIICTYNGAKRLPDTIAYIARLVVPTGFSFEVILADNNSADHSSAVAITEWNTHNRSSVPFKTINEPIPGKLYALQQAVEKASYEYLIICDDDNWLAPDYLTKICTHLDNMPEVAAVGGMGIPVTGGAPLPNWFKDYHFAYAVGSQAKQTGKLRAGNTLWGAGLATRKSVYLEMYKDFPSLLPLSEKNILSAEDTEYCIRLLLKGYILYYDHSLTYKHFIPAFKLTKKFLNEKLLKGFKDSKLILRKYYPALKVKLKTRGRPDLWLYLLVVAFIRYLIFLPGERAIKAKDTLFHLFPFWIKSDPISTQIKSFSRD